jgi:hypothetical protein
MKKSLGTANTRLNSVAHNTEILTNVPVPDVGICTVKVEYSYVKPFLSSHEVQPEPAEIEIQIACFILVTHQMAVYKKKSRWYPVNTDSDKFWTMIEGMLLKIERVKEELYWARIYSGDERDKTDVIDWVKNNL